MKHAEAIMQILEAYDLCHSYRAASQLAGCSDRTVARYVALRDAGNDPAAPAGRVQQVGPYKEKVIEWVERSHGKVRADVCHDRLQALGYLGSERTTRRAVAEAKQSYRKGHRRVYRPWITEPGLWFQWDWGKGPGVGGRGTSLWCAWLAWSKCRVVLPVWDRTFPTVVACLDRTFRAFGGVPTYGLTDNEKTVTLDHVAGVPVRHPELLAVARHYGFTVATCVPYDPESKGGSEATVRVAKADLVPAEANLLEEYGSFAGLEAACAAFCTVVNGRPHRATGRPPTELLEQEHLRLHRLPERPHTLAFGQTRRVGWESTISFGGVAYSVPTAWVEETVWCRVYGEELVIVALGKTGAEEVARHRLSTPGQPRIDPAHYPPRAEGLPQRRPHGRTPEETAFLALGEGASRWLVAAAAQGTTRLRRKMAEAVTLAKLEGGEWVDRALGEAAAAGRFGEGDLGRILAYLRSRKDTQGTGSEAGALQLALDPWSLQPGTAAWHAVGR